MERLDQTIQLNPTVEFRETRDASAERGERKATSDVTLRRTPRLDLALSMQKINVKYILIDEATPNDAFENNRRLVLASGRAGPLRPIRTLCPKRSTRTLVPPPVRSPLKNTAFAP